uniref:Uncharacterized protein n=1 Tax=Romanomermis culicivorax TaxID=13658 RepID=A0A915K5J8_ROMCU
MNGVLINLFACLWLLDDNIFRIDNMTTCRLNSDINLDFSSDDRFVCFSFSSNCILSADKSFKLCSNWHSFSSK